jgi:hypothetical protein
LAAATPRVGGALVGARGLLRGVGVIGPDQRLAQVVHARRAVRAPAPIRTPTPAGSRAAKRFLVRPCPSHFRHDVQKLHFFGAAQSASAAKSHFAQAGERISPATLRPGGQPRHAAFDQAGNDTVASSASAATSAAGATSIAPSIGISE